MTTNTFSGDTLTMLDNNAGNGIFTGLELLFNTPLATQIAYAASLGNGATDTVVFVDARGGSDFIFLDDFVIENGGVQAGRYVVDAGNGADVVIGSSYGDLINGGNGPDELYGGGGADTINGGNGNDEIYGGSGNDLLNGDDGNDYIEGGSGNDIINGGNGNDRMFGDGGNDILNGGRGNDRYTGGAGADDFIFDSDGSGATDELDRILDWNRGRDQIDLTGVIGLATVEVYATGAARAEMLLLNGAGDAILTIDVQATNAGGRNILLQDSAYGDGANDRVLVNAGVTIDLPNSVIVI